MNTLQQAVIEQLGYTVEDLENENEDLLSTLSDISNHGIDGGFSGFIYYGDTVEFFDNNKRAILSELQEVAEGLGESKYQLAASFGCFNGEYTVDNICDAIYTKDHEDETQVKNALAWFAGEEVARSLTNW